MIYHTLLTFLHLHIVKASVAPSNVAFGQARKIIPCRISGRGRDTWAGTWATATRSVWICCLDPEDETGLKWKSNRTPADVSPLVWMDHGVTLDTRAAYLLATCHTGTGTMIRFFYCSENVNKHVICAGSEGDNWEWGTIIMRSNMMTTIR